MAGSRTHRSNSAAGISFAPVTDEDWAAEYYSLDIAAGVVYLASQEAGYVTGQTLHINGGMAMI